MNICIETELIGSLGQIHPLHLTHQNYLGSVLLNVN